MWISMKLVEWYFISLFPWKRRDCPSLSKAMAALDNTSHLWSPLAHHCRSTKTQENHGRSKLPCHPLFFCSPHSVPSLSQTANCGELHTQPECFQDTSPWNLPSSRARYFQINTSDWMPRNKVSGYCYKESGEKFNTSDKKKKKPWHFERPFPQCTWPYCQMCNPYQKQLLRGGLYSHWALPPRSFFEGKTKLALAKQVWELNKKAVLFSERKGCFTAVSRRINPDCQKEFFSQQGSQKPHQSFAYISFNRFHPSSVLEETIWGINLVRFSVRTKRT